MAVTKEEFDVFKTKVNDWFMKIIPDKPYAVPIIMAYTDPTRDNDHITYYPLPKEWLRDRDTLKVANTVCREFIHKFKPKMVCMITSAYMHEHKFKGQGNISEEEMKKYIHELVAKGIPDKQEVLIMSFQAENENSILIFKVEKDQEDRIVGISPMQEHQLNGDNMRGIGGNWGNLYGEEIEEDPNMPDHSF